MLMVNQLAGFGVGPGGVAPRITSITQQAFATSTGGNIVVPASVIAGDLLVLGQYALNLALPPAVNPPGFTTISSLDDGASERVMLSYKVAVGGEASSTLTGMNGLANYKTLYVFRGNLPFLAANVSGVVSVRTLNSNPPGQVIPASAGPAPLVVIGLYTAVVNAGVDPRIMSPAKDGEISAAAQHWQAYKIYTSDPANVTIDMDHEGNAGHCLQGCYISVS
jgi:hypothetical protein